MADNSSATATHTYLRLICFLARLYGIIQVLKLDEGEILPNLYTFQLSVGLKMPLDVPCSGVDGVEVDNE